MAIWVNDLERMKTFYSKYFGAVPGSNYSNLIKNFESCILRFEKGAALELMRKTNQLLAPQPEEYAKGFSHIAFSVGSKDRVDELTSLFEKDGYFIAGYPRVTGDGYYESVITDPEGNRIELTI